MQKSKKVEPRKKNVSYKFVKKSCEWHHQKHITDIIEFDDFINDVIVEYLSENCSLKFAILRTKQKLVRKRLLEKNMKKNLTILTSGTLNNFENIMPKKVTKFLDSIEERYKKAESKQSRQYYHQKLVDIVTDLYDSY